jgi:gas vesicle protein
MMPKSGKRFSDNITRKKESMMPKSVKQFSDDIMSEKKDNA